jgi:uncharacterized membrane protein YbhN (UPF0104 family)
VRDAIPETTYLRLAAVVLALAVLAALAWHRRKLGRELDRSRKVRGAPPPPTFRRKDIPNYRLFVRTCGLSAILLVVAVPAFLLTAGPNPSVQTPIEVRFLIYLATYISILVFLCSGGILLGLWLIERYGDR